MAKSKEAFFCQNCGASSPKWQGQCAACGEWNTLIAETVPARSRPLAIRTAGSELSTTVASQAIEETPRLPTGSSELDRVLGGGLVAGSVTLIGGDPGIGKSTLLLQVVAALATGRGAAKLKCAYISGEEAIDQVRLRAQRLGVASAPVELAAATNIRDIAASLETVGGPDVVVIDSIQTMYLDTLDSSPGTVSQVRAAAQELIRLAKRVGFTLVLVGHVTKEGLIAGPRVLEHMVDTVLYFEGERGHQFRILRAVKNRFGPTDEIGVFEMTDAGLAEVPNPSALFLADRHGDVSGAAVFAGMEGTRPVLVEIQALVAPSPPGTPRRAVVGWDTARLAMVMAVLDARCGLAIGTNDVYLNVAGGLRIGEPAADLAVAAALVSALTGSPVPVDMVVFGEIGLSGEVRPVSQSDARLKEAGKLGFEQALAPARRGRGKQAPQSIAIKEVAHLHELVEMFDTTAHSGAPAGRIDRD
jgi:DNA repair protein RadA/Sms